MNALVQRWPEFGICPTDAKAKIRFARDQLAGKEMQVGRYYLERRDYIAAINRFRGVVENYGKTREVEEALARLTEAYMAMGLDLGGADGGCGARAQLSRQPLVQGLLRAAAVGRAVAAREHGLMDLEGRQEDLRLTVSGRPCCHICRSAISS